ncbi:MAG: PEP-CTERM sorting domain-containing protein [Planctomycetota bacterium]|nr:PEP-CTERM sorting domain-containing protein [Planctomycetota bacterium]
MNWLRVISGILIVAVFSIAPPPIQAIIVVEDPTVIEDFNNPYQIEYTVINPPASSVGDIVGFVIEVEAPGFSPFYCDTANNWECQALTSTDWNSVMEADNYPYNTYALTWSQFFGDIDYPFATDQPAAGYFMAYSETGSYAFDSPDLAVSPGESLDQFFVDAMPMSTFVLAHTPDANATFNSGDFSTFEGEAIPEPATLSLITAGGLALLTRKRKS